MRRAAALTALLALALAPLGCGGEAAPEPAAETAVETAPETPEIMAEHPVTSPAAMAAGIVDVDGTAAGSDEGEGEAAEAAPAAGTPRVAAGSEPG